MTITTLLFDLDGTLLPMDQEEFIRFYMDSISRYAAGLGYDPETFVKALWAGTESIYKNRSEKPNREVFLARVRDFFGPKFDQDEPLFDTYYENDFQKIADICPPDPEATAAVKRLKKDYRLILATNPLFPRAATRSRIRWAGLDPDDFELVTTYENSTRSKPNPEYFTEILAKMNLKPEECLMIGNDLTEDASSLQAGIPLFVVDKNLINRQNRNLEDFPHGSFSDLSRYLDDQKNQEGSQDIA